VNLTGINSQSPEEVYNMLGEKIFTEALNNSKTAANINLTSSPNGVYLYRILETTGNLLGEGKLIIQR